MKLKRKVELVFWMVTLGAVPAWANNPPQPDGLFSLILIFPVVIFGFRLAKASYTDGERKWRWLRGLLLGFLVVLAMAGDDVAQIPLLVFLIFGLRRGIQIMYRGQGRKRFFVGALVCLWTLFALGDYGISLMVWSPVPSHEFATIRNLRFLAQAEQTYARTSPSGQFATIKQLQDAKIPLATEFSQPGEDSNPALYDLYMNNYVYVGYRFSSMVDADGKKFLITAVPAAYAKDIKPLIPGTSWWILLRSRGRKRTPEEIHGQVGQRCFAIDESGVIRAADLGTTRPVTREEVEKWKPIGER